MLKFLGLGFLKDETGIPKKDLLPKQFDGRLAERIAKSAGNKAGLAWNNSQG
jgi:hypothetical protein